MGSWSASTCSRLTALTGKATVSRCLNRPTGSADTACIAACVSLGGNRPKVRERIGEWLSRGSGREFLVEMESHFSHLGPGANHAPVAEQLRREFAAEIEKARREDDDCCGNRAAESSVGNQKVTTC